MTGHEDGKGPRVRLVTVDDVAELVRLRRLMFDSMGIDTTDTRWEDVARSTIAKEILEGRMIAAVVSNPETDRELIASGIVQFEARLPSPENAAAKKAHLSSMSTDPHWRKRGYANDVLELLISECRNRGVGVVSLYATADGRPLYERAGFRERGPGSLPELQLILPT